MATNYRHDVAYQLKLFSIHSIATPSSICFFHQQVEVVEENVGMVADQAAEITTNTEEITSDGVDAVAEILTDITAIGSGDVEVTMYIFCHPERH